MATLQQLETALKNADAAGDMDAARKLAAVVSRARKDPSLMREDIAGNMPQIPETVQPEQPMTPDELMRQEAARLGTPEEKIGQLEAVAALGTGATTGMLGMAGGAIKGIAQQLLSGEFGTQQAADLVEQEAMKGAQAFTYQPRTGAGQQYVERAGEIAQQIAPAIPPLTDISASTAMASGARQAAPIVASGALDAADAMARQGQSAVGAIRQGAGAVAEKVGSAVQSLRPSPERIPGVDDRRSVGAAETDLESQRIAEAQQVGINLTEGEAKRSQEMLAWEKEKAKTPEFQAPFVQRQQENNRQAIRNFEVLLDDINPATGTMEDTGIKVVDSLMKGYEAEKAKTRKLYAAAREKGEMAERVSMESLVDLINKNASSEEVAPILKTAKRELVRLGGASIDENGMLYIRQQGEERSPFTNTVTKPASRQTLSLEQAERLRELINKSIGYEGPNLKYGVDIKKAIDSATDDKGGPEYRAARAQRRNQAVKFENRAIVARLVLEKRNSDDPQVPIEDVFKKTILSARPSEIIHLRRVLSTMDGKDAAGKEVWRELQGATVRYIQEEASKGALGSDNLPTITSHNLDRVLKQFDKNGKLDLVLGVKAAEQIRTLNQVLKYVQTTPPGTSINNSGTARTIMAMLAEAGATGAATGIPVPIIQGMKMLRSEIKDRKIRDRITKALNYQKEREQQ